MRSFGFCLFVIVVFTMLAVWPGVAGAQIVPPATIMGTVTVNGVPTNGILVSGGGGSSTTHDGGRYTFDVAPGTVNVTATYQGFTGSSGPFTIASGGFAFKNISISTVVAPVASFTSNMTNGMAPLAIRFTDASSNGPTSWQWSFGDGSPNVTSQNATHVYTSGGTFNVILTVTNSAGSSTIQRSGFIKVNNATPVAGFNSNVTGGYAPLSVRFNDISTGNNITMWLWDFGDGTNSTIENPVHVFASPGVYTVTLTVTNDGGTNIKAVQGYITALNVPPAASFTSNVTSGEAPLAVFFTDASSNGPTWWQWSFGDGSPNVTSQNATHVYNSAGTYDVTLTVANSGGNSTLQKTGYIVVSPADNHTSFNLSLRQGWNLVSSPLVVDPAVNVSMFKGTGVTMVAQYNRTTGGFDIYRVGKTPTAFPFVEGQGYFLYCGNDTTFAISGFDETGQSTTISQGWNLIGWTSLTGSNSKLLASGLNNVTMMARYNATTGSYDIYRVGKTPTPFAIQAGEGYFLYTTYAGPQTLTM